MSQEKNFRIALVGNPNTGRTTLFNKLTGSRNTTGNYPRVTVGVHEASFEHKGWHISIVDLPGNYSLSSQTDEELLTRELIFSKSADLIVNVLDMGKLERNLMLASEMIEMGIPCLFALNMKDEAEAKGIRIDCETFSKLVASPVLEISARSGEGTEQLKDAIVSLAEQDEQKESVRIGYDDHLEATIRSISTHIEMLHPEEFDQAQARWLAIKLLEGDESVLRQESEHVALMRAVNHDREVLEKQHGEDAGMMLNNGRFGFINGLLLEVREIDTSEQVSRTDVTRVLDSILLHRFLGLPLFLGFMWLIFEATFTLGIYPVDWIIWGVDGLTNVLNSALPESMFKKLMVDGVLAGVGGTIVFLPNIVILFFFIAFLSESGYLARAAYLVDRMMHAFGLHGKAFIPMVTGFGCNVPAILATRTIENKKDRLVAMLVTPFMSCSARLPVFILFSGAFFAEHAGKVLFGMYVTSVVIALLTAVVLSKFFIKGANTSPLLMELPPYRSPTMNSIMVHMGANALSFLKKVGGIIVVGSTIIWFLQTFPQEVPLSKDYGKEIHTLQKLPESENRDSMITDLSRARDAETRRGSYLGQIGGVIQPIFKPLGFDLNSSIALLTGFVAKEVVVATYGVLFAQGENVTHEDKTLQEAISETMTPLTAIVFMVFVLFYMPCFATLAMLYRESGSLKWTTFSVVISMVVAYSLSYSITVVGGLII